MNTSFLPTDPTCDAAYQEDLRPFHASIHASVSTPDTNSKNSPKPLTQNPFVSANLTQPLLITNYLRRLSLENLKNLTQKKIMKTKVEKKQKMNTEPIPPHLIEAQRTPILPTLAAERNFQFTKIHFDPLIDREIHALQPCTHGAVSPSSGSTVRSVDA